MSFHLKKFQWLFYLCALSLGLSLFSMPRCTNDDKITERTISVVSRDQRLESERTISVASRDLKLESISVASRDQRLESETTISVAASRDQKLEPCRIAVTNSVAWHYETLESIAALLPAKYINLSNSTCDNTSLVFDYHIFGDGERDQSWIYYFHVGMQGKLFKTDDNIQRVIGNLHVYLTINNKHGIIEPGDRYDAVIEASCYCLDGPVKNVNHVWWMKANPRRTCIFHEKCLIVSDYPTAVWPSPHHQHYYIPAQLPVQKRPRKKRKSLRNKPHQLCVVGATHRRNWGLLQSYLEAVQPNFRFRIHILGSGDYPKELEAYRTLVNISSVDDYQQFHRLAAQCDGILTLVSKNTHENYFVSENSLLKLSGTLPIVIAYRVPVFIHEELYDLYKDYLTAIATTHNNQAQSFMSAMHLFLDKLDQLKV